MEDFIGFTYNGVHSIRDLKIYRTSNSSRYDENMTAAMTDLTADVPGGDGQYYFGTTFKNRTFQISFAFDNLYEEDIAKIKQTFRGDGIHDLVFDETPYKAWGAKVTGTATLKHLCFEENGRRVYRGEGNITFTCYYPYAHTPEKLWTVTNKGKTDEKWTYSSLDGKNKNNYSADAYPNKEEWLVNGILTNYDALTDSLSRDYREVCGDRPISFIIILTAIEQVKTNKFYVEQKYVSNGATVDVTPSAYFSYDPQTLSSGDQLIFNSKTRLLTRKNSNGTEEIIPYTYSGNIFTIQPGYSFAPNLAFDSGSGSFIYTCKYNFEYL